MTGWWFTEGSLQEPVRMFLGMLLTMNISLAVFNLLAVSPARWQQDPGDFSSGERPADASTNGTVWLHHLDGVDLRGLL